MYTMIHEIGLSILLFGMFSICGGHRGHFFHRRRFIPVKTEVRAWYPQNWALRRHSFVPPFWNIPSVVDGNGFKHVHSSFNGQQFEHSHSFGDHTHSHDANGNPVFPEIDAGSPYAGTGMHWQIPENWRDLNSWAVVNPDSILTVEDMVPSAPGDGLLPDVDTSLGIFPDPAKFPTSDKEDNQSPDVKPLDPVVPVNKNTKTGTTKDSNIDIVITQVETTQTPELPTTRSPLPDITAPKVNTSIETCHKTGCPTGHECAYSESYICPIYLDDVPCECRPGCRVDYTFVPFGQTISMDNCGNTCSCLNLYGAPECTRKACEKFPEVPKRGDLQEVIETPVVVKPIVTDSKTMTDMKKPVRSF